MAGEAGGPGGPPSDEAPSRLEGRWGEITVAFGDPASADWTVDLGVGRPVPVEVRGDHHLAARRARGQAGLVTRAILAGAVAGRGGALLHAAAVVDAAGDATLFLGPSGAGKTTVSTQAEGRLLGDDTVLVWPEGDGLVVLATPFMSEGGRPPEAREARPVAVCTLGWGEVAVARRLSRRALLQALLESLYRPPPPLALAPVMATVLRLAAAATGHHLIFPRDLRFTPAILEAAEG